MSIKSALNQSSLFRFTVRDIFITGDECSDLLKSSYFHCPIYQLSLIRQHCVVTKFSFLASSQWRGPQHNYKTWFFCLCCVPSSWATCTRWHTFLPIITPIKGRLCRHFCMCLNHFSTLLCGCLRDLASPGGLCWAETLWPHPLLSPSWLGSVPPRQTFS